MKKTLTTLCLILSAGFALGHGGIELGPNKGRILEFSTDESMHGEVTEKDGKLQIALLDKEMKPVKPGDHSLAVTAGTRQKPEKVEVTKDDKGFTLKAPDAGQWLIIQYKATPDAKAVTARLHFDTRKCDPCGNPEWRCACED
jgi:hypothetical protein